MILNLLNLYNKNADSLILSIKYEIVTITLSHLNPKNNLLLY